MGAPEKDPDTQPRRVECRIQPKQVLYVRDALEAQGYGTSEPQVIYQLMQIGIQQLIRDGVIGRRAGRVTWADVPDPPSEKRPTKPKDSGTAGH